MYQHTNTEPGISWQLGTTDTVSSVDGSVNNSTTVVYPLPNCARAGFISEILARSSANQLPANQPTATLRIDRMESVRSIGFLGLNTLSIIQGDAVVRSENFEIEIQAINGLSIHVKLRATGGALRGRTVFNGLLPQCGG